MEKRQDEMEVGIGQFDIRGYITFEHWTSSVKSKRKKVLPRSGVEENRICLPPAIPMVPGKHISMERASKGGRRMGGNIVK